MSELVLDIGPVSRASSHVIVGLAGRSGDGKTFTALELAYGLAGGDASKIGFLDTEEGRGALYDDLFDKPYQYARLRAPFSPRRYSQAILQFANAGIEALIVDSTSHEWAGDGGCDDIAAASLAKGKKMADWLTAKREHFAFMRSLLSMPCHLILCFRAKNKSDYSDPREIKDLGIQPICEKDVMYEMTVSFMLENEGKQRTPLKSIPRFFPFLAGTDGYLTREHGRQMREWFTLKKGDLLNEKRKSLQFAASSGSEALKKAWSELSRVEKSALESFKDTLKDAAAHADGDGGLSDEAKVQLIEDEKAGRLVS